MSESDLSFDSHFAIRGLRLVAGTQRVFHHALIAHHAAGNPDVKRQTKVNLALTQHAVRCLWGNTPPEPQIWKSVRNKELPRNIRNFLWKSIHGCYKIGEYWLKIPLHEMRGTCLLCGETESMQHILTECTRSPFRAIIWHLAERLWSMRGSQWPLISFGTILGAGLADFRRDGRRQIGETRLFTILILESAHLIWKLRCDWVINKGTTESIPTHDEIHNKWVNAINLRLKFDRLQTDIKRYGNKAIKQDTVLKTWRGTLLNETNLPDNWIWKSGVLVGITPRRPPGRGR
ncbi:hypothetical protein M404DRAFT_137520 [Pisolithus tinctorius Marx 270]|uniref:Reverse transcriptase zinc-binding domain-containing protein n=1 Tax=Pisolithus tinctorius Marx 270 TaxID=870435 RepID=A0A0C3P1W3_PISTI|nr:hypothetical protein M404DRAFT_137520 [Pisolithus tinctorius Marx 270]